MTVCAAAATATSCAASPSWSGGWIVFTDADADRVLDTGDAIIHRVRLDSSGFSLGPPSGSAILAGVTFRGTGYPKVAGTFTYCDSKSTQDLALNLVGRIEITDTGHGCL